MDSTDSSQPDQQQTLRSSSSTVAGIILAAGESSRMGRDKALLPLGADNFIRRLLKVLQGAVSPIVIVLGHHAEEIQVRIPAVEGIVVLRNLNYSLGQLSSMQVALRHLLSEPAQAALVALVDHPAISRNVVQMLLKRFEERHPPILIPTCKGRRGHPVIFARSLFQELLDAPLNEGARAVVHHHAAEVELVETDDDGILLDIDFPTDYRALLARWNSIEPRGGMH